MNYKYSMILKKKKKEKNQYDGITILNPSHIIIDILWNILQLIFFYTSQKRLLFSDHWISPIIWNYKIFLLYYFTYLLFITSMEEKKTHFSSAL